MPFQPFEIQGSSCDQSEEPKQRKTIEELSAEHFWKLRNGEFRPKTKAVLMNLPI